MYPILLHHLPDIVARARDRARVLLPLARDRTAASPAPDGEAVRHVHLLRGDALAAMLGLLHGRLPDALPPEGVPVIWLGGAQGEAPPRTADSPPMAQELLQFTVRLFVARELLSRQGVLAVSVLPGHTADQHATRLLGAVFGPVPAPLPLRPQDSSNNAHTNIYFAGAPATVADTQQDEGALLRALVKQHSRPSDTILLAPAAPAHATSVVMLHRRWVLAQPDAETFQQLRTQLIADQASINALPLAGEQQRSWPLLL